MKIESKLMTIQQKLNAPKNNYNSFGKYSYRSCEDILESVKPLLAETKTVLTISDKLVCMGNRFYVEANATLIDTESDERISNTAYAREGEQKKGMDESQITGSSSSYARKYALNGLFCIDDVKDADTRDNRPQADVEFTQMATADQTKKIADRCNAERVSLSKLLELYKVTSINDLSPKQINNINDNWEKVKGACAV